MHFLTSPMIGLHGALWLAAAILLGAAAIVLFVVRDARPSSFRSRFERDRDALLARPVPPAPTVTDADLASLPPLMQTYLRRTGAVGRPRVHNLRVRFDAQMRSSATAPWMQSTAIQYEFFNPPARLFHLNATRSGVPIDVLHRYVDGAATFQVKIAGLFSIVDKSGPVLTRTETVTLMNDIVVMAPAAVLDLPFAWETVGDNRGSRKVPWSTPISGYRDVDGIRIGALGDANWVEPSGE